MNYSGLARKRIMIMIILIATVAHEYCSQFWELGHPRSRPSDLKSSKACPMCPEWHLQPVTWIFTRRRHQFQIHITHHPISSCGQALIICGSEAAFENGTHSPHTIFQSSILENRGIECTPRIPLLLPFLRREESLRCGEMPLAWGNSRSVPGETHAVVPCVM